MNELAAITSIQVAKEKLADIKARNGILVMLYRLKVITLEGWDD